MKLDSSVDREALRMVGTMLRFVRIVDRRFRRTPDADLSLTDLSVLAQIEHGADLPSLVARRLPMDPPRVTRITDRLVALGYIERTVDCEDRRRCRLRLTPAGGECLQNRLLATSQAVDTILEHLPIEDRVALLRGLKAVRPVLDALSDVPPTDTG